MNNKAVKLKENKYKNADLIMKDEAFPQNKIILSHLDNPHTQVWIFRLI